MVRPSEEYSQVELNNHDDTQSETEENELKSVSPQPGKGTEADDRLLPHNNEHNVWDEVTLSTSRKRRKSVWLPCLLALFCLLGIFAVLVGLLRVVIPKPKRLNTVPSFRRPESEYILSTAWDFTAPPQVREYHWTISEMDADPDGVMKHMLVINRQFPGELIRCNEGDTIVVNVENRATNSTAIHWHGIFQNGTNEMDGVPGITQCPIAPGGKFRYEFTVKGQSGTYFYHSHMAAQAADGLFGPIVVHARDEKETQPIPYASDRVVLVQDWYYDSSYSLLMEKLSPGSESAPIPNGALINGRNKADCAINHDRVCNSSTAAYATMELAPAENHRLRLVNVGVFAWFQVSVDEHPPLSLIEIDGTTITPAPEESILIGPAQRYSVILTASPSTPSASWFRARMMKHCFGEVVEPLEGFDEVRAIITPSTGSLSALPTTEKNTSLPYATECLDMDPTRYSPSPPVSAPETADTSLYLRVNLEIGDWRLQRGVLNESSFRTNMTAPSLQRIVDNLPSEHPSRLSQSTLADLFSPKTQLTHLSPTTTSTIDVILQNFDEGNHPFHLHGHTFFVLAAGHGYFPGYEHLNMHPLGAGLLNSANRTVIENPLRRDVATVEGFGWLWLRFRADNPGVWLFHCHMLWHGESGMGMQFVTGTDQWDREKMLSGEERRLCEAPVGELRKGATPGDELWFGHFD